MKQITTKQFQPLTDMQLVWGFMEEVYEHSFGNGAPAPFFEYALTSSWMNKDYLHLNRLWLDGAQAVGFVFYEDPVTHVFFSLRPGYEELAEEMVIYAEQAMPSFRNQQELVLFGGQSAFLEVVRKRGYELSWENVDLICDFRKTELRCPLPEGFHFVDPQECDPLKLALCTWKGFDHEDKGAFENWQEEQSAEWTPARSYQGVLSSTIAPPPHATHEYNVIIADEQGEYACFSGMWWVPKNKLAYMEPLCTIPKYRRKGLAAAALSKHYETLKPLGAELMTGGGDVFYSKIGYEDGVHWLHFRKRFAVEK